MGEIDRHCVLFNEIMNENDSIYRKLSKTFGMSECALRVLYTLRVEGGAMLQSEICAYIFQPKQPRDTDGEGRRILRRKAEKSREDIII